MSLTKQCASDRQFHCLPYYRVDKLLLTVIYINSKENTQKGKSLISTDRGAFLAQLCYCKGMILKSLAPVCTMEPNKK